LKLLATKQLVKFVSKDITPSAIAAGDGFIQMAWLLIHVRAKHGAVSAKCCNFPQQIYRGSKVKLQLLQSVSKAIKDLQWNWWSNDMGFVE